MGSNNDINNINHSAVFDEVLKGRALEVNYTITVTTYTMEYYLTDDIYPEWAIFVKTISRL